MRQVYMSWSMPATEAVKKAACDRQAYASGPASGCRSVVTVHA